MAEFDYRPLSCVQCSSLFPRSITQSGAPRKNQRSTCSDPCESQRIRVAKGAILRRADVQCVHCAQSFRPRQGNAMYCSKACKMRVFSRARDPLIGSRLQAKREAKLARAEARQTAKRLAVQAHLSITRQAALRSCAWCEVAFCSLLGQVMRYCSEACCKANRRECKKAARVARKAIERAARVETVSPRKVFARDGWQCYLCGCEHNAPELEHVVPLSKGGEHSYANVKCACRACNVAKGDASLDEIGGAYRGGRVAILDSAAP